MTVADKRLEEVAGGLILRERAIISLREGYAGRTPDDKLRRVLRPDDPDCKEMIEAIHEASGHFHHALACMTEWLFQVELQIGWLECLDAMLARDNAAIAALSLAGWTVSEDPDARTAKREKLAVLPPLPKPGLGVNRTLPYVMGRNAFPDDEDVVPDDLKSLRKQLAFAAQRSLGMRWRDYLGITAILEELTESLGERLVHPEVDELLEPVRAKILELHEALGRCGEAPVLPDYDEDAITKYRSWVRWDDFAEPQEVAAAKPKPWVSVTLQQELDEIEARLAGEIRVRK